MKIRWITLAIFLLVAGFVCVEDAVTFHRVQRGIYMTPWYSPRWWRSPYTSFRVAMSSPRERWTKNAVGDDWYVREAVIDGKEWWTILKKVEASRYEHRK